MSLLLSVYKVSNVRQKEIHAAEPLEPDPGTFEVEMTNLILKGMKHQVVIKF
jgi:hypothetical protein